MAWIELHEELPQHPKTTKLARVLHVQRTCAIGHIVLLFTWALRHAQDGIISRYEAPEIADGCLWEGDPDEFISALRSSGWVDDTENGLEIHDWWQYAGRLVERRLANADRMRKSRAKGVRDTCDERAQHVDERAGATVPNLTVPKEDKSSSSGRKPPKEYPEEVHRLANLLADLMFANAQAVSANPKREKVTAAWLQEIDLLLRKDGRPTDEAEAVLRWSQADSFWKTNIRSPSKLRLKYDELLLKKHATRTSTPPKDDFFSLSRFGLGESA